MTMETSLNFPFRPLSPDLQRELHRLRERDLKGFLLYDLSAAKISDFDVHPSPTNDESRAFLKFRSRRYFVTGCNSGKGGGKLYGILMTKILAFSRIPPRFSEFGLKLGHSGRANGDRF